MRQDSLRWRDYHRLHSDALMTPPLSLCKSCHAQIYWVQTESGKNMPVADGNIIFVNEKAHVLRKDEEPGDVKRWVSHFVTCANSKQHRRKT